jgi:hypothetical protein
LLKRSFALVFCYTSSALARRPVLPTRHPRQTYPVRTAGGKKPVFEAASVGGLFRSRRTQSRDTPIWKIEGRAKLPVPRKGRYAPPVLTATQEITPYRWGASGRGAMKQPPHPVAIKLALSWSAPRIDRGRCSHLDFQSGKATKPAGLCLAGLHCDYPKGRALWAEPRPVPHNRGAVRLGRRLPGR